MFSDTNVCGPQPAGGDFRDVCGTRCGADGSVAIIATSRFRNAGFALTFCSVEYIGQALPPVQLPGLGSVEQTCWDEFHNSSIRLFAAIDSRLKLVAGITLTDVRLLNLLAASDYGCFRRSEICRALMVTPSRVTQLIRQLKIRRLVSQSATPYDRRGIRVGITVAGRARLEAAQQIVAEVVRTHYLGGMSRPQMLMLAESHRRINARLDLRERSATFEDLVHDNSHS